MEKAALRELMSRKRAALGTVQKNTYADLIHDRIWELPHIESCRNLHCYLSFGNEVRTERIFQTCHGRGISAFAPYQLPGTSRLGSAPWKPGDETALGPMNVPQPIPGAGDVTARIPWDVILVPGLAFDRRGGRVGYGKGYYDRLLGEVMQSRRNSRQSEEQTTDSRDRELAVPAVRPMVVGLAYSVQLVDNVPIDPWDMPLNAIVTENETILCA